jgi:hypothetical protein
MTRHALLLGGLLALAGALPAAADEAKAPISASLLLQMSSPRIESSRSAFDESLREALPPVSKRLDGEVQPDGSVKYGNVTVTVRNPCPPGEHYEPMPLPGRRTRR